MRGGVHFKACIWGSLKWKFSEPGLIWGPACMPMQNGTWLVKVKIYIWEPERQHCITKRTNTQRRKVGTFTQGYHLHPIYLYPYTSPLCTSFLLWFLLPLNLQDIPEISFEGDGDIFIIQARVLWRINVNFLCTDACFHLANSLSPGSRFCYSKTSILYSNSASWTEHWTELKVWPCHKERPKKPILMTHHATPISN